MALKVKRPPGRAVSLVRHHPFSLSQRISPSKENSGGEEKRIDLRQADALA